MTKDMTDLAMKYPELIFAYKNIKKGKEMVINHQSILDVQEPSIFIIEHINKKMIKYKLNGNITIETIDNFV